MDIKEFEKYLIMQKSLNEASISKYTGAIKVISREFKVELLEISDLDEYVKCKKQIFENEKFKIKNSTGNQMYSSALNYYEKFLKNIKYNQILQQSKDIIPDEYDGSYELMRETVKQYNFFRRDRVGFEDVDLIYFMTIGTWKIGIEAKKNLIEKSHLDDVKKQYLKDLLDRIMAKTKNGEYNNYDITKGRQIGMFGTGLATFAKYGDRSDSYVRFIELCIRVNELPETNEEGILEFTNEILQQDMYGFGVATISTVLHCLKPMIFPIINGKEGEGTELYRILGIDINKNYDLKNYVADVKNIREYRNKNFLWKNYRVLDLIKLKNDSDEGEQAEKFENDNNFVGENRIYYGVPGCGKSYLVTQEMEKEENGKKIYDKYIRITFHPDFTHADFIGQLLPVKNKETGCISYEFVEKPFSKILKDAIHNPSKNYCVIIEEINRGNAPAIFGDIFQLLDRLKENKGVYVKGDSQYPIQDKDLLEYINKDIEKEEIEEVYIPHNLSIFATMNSNDQNVFTLDTAFKRRWHFIRISNKFGKDDEEQRKQKIQKLGVKWGDFVEQINERIISIKNIGFNNEDKQIGKYFLSKQEINDENLFAEKLLAYLWEDVLRFNKEEMFKNPTTLDKLIEDYKTKGKEIFSFDFKEESIKE